MSQMVTDEARLWFYEPFYETKRGHIVGLATTRENMRDGLSIARVARFFPLPDYEGIVVEPGRESMRKEHNVILVGWAWLFIDPDPQLVAGAQPPASVGREKLGRVVQLYERCCLTIVSEGHDRAVINTLTGKRYEPCKPEGSDEIEIDYGVIRRWFHGPFKNTIVLEGLHRLGTIGTAKAATDPVILKTLKDAWGRLPGRADSMPIEVLVKAEFPGGQDGIYTLEDTKVDPLLMTCNGQYVLDLGRRESDWLDLRPWDVNLYACDRAPALPVPSGRSDGILPRLELRVDLQNRSERVRTLCRRVLIEHEPDGSEAMELVEALVAEAERFDIELWETGGKGSVTRLPSGKTTDVRLERKRFLVHLGLLRLLDPEPQLPCTAELIRRNYPSFRPRLDGVALEDAFVNSIPGRMRAGFVELLGPAKDPKHYLRYPCVRTDAARRTYRFELDRINLVVKLRI